MQTHTEKETGGPEAGTITAEAGLEEGADFRKKEGGLRVLTTDGVKKMAEALRLRRQATQERLQVDEPVQVPEPPEDAPEWRPGPAAEVAIEELDENVDVYATVRRQHFNRRMLGCELEGKAGMVNVRVRDGSYYRNGEQFAVHLNSVGEWEATQHRMAPRYP